MIYLVTGGSGSGKSAYAEELVLQSGNEKRYYIATMEVFGEEGKKKVERHRKLREGKGMITIERPLNLSSLVLEEWEGEEKEESEAEKELREVKEENSSKRPADKTSGRDSTVLLECMTNLSANELFSREAVQVGESCFWENKSSQENESLQEVASSQVNTCESFIMYRARVAAERIKEGIRRLEEQCGLLVVVSGEVFSDGIDYGEETNAYIELMGEMNCWLAERAERAVEVVYGIGCVLK